MIGIGVDLVRVSRVRQARKRRGERFEARVLSLRERDQCGKHVAPDVYIACRFAAKEACLKALGTGWAGGVAFPQVQVGSGGDLVLGGAARLRAEKLGVVHARVTFTIQGDLVAAMVVLDG